MDGLISRIHAILTNGNVKVATAESCTSGLLAAALTELPGSSSYYLGGVNSYANEAKQVLLGLPAAMIDTDGAVSERVAQAMAEGVREILGADIGISLTGIAGPGGGSEEKPVGTVYLGFATGERSNTRRLKLSGDRQTIRAASVDAALQALLEHLEQ